MDDTPPRFEDEYPEVAAQLVLLANGQHPVIRQLHVGKFHVELQLKNGTTRRTSPPAPNAPCPCGSGKKFKKCCRS